MRNLILAVLVGLPIFAQVFSQVFLPARRISTPTPVSAESTNPPFSGDLVVWLWAKSFDSVEADGAPLKYWPDISGNSNYFTNTTVNNTRPLYKTNQINGLSAVDFRCTSNQFFFAHTPVGVTNDWWNEHVATGYHLFIVCKFVETGACFFTGASRAGGLFNMGGLGIAPNAGKREAMRYREIVPNKIYMQFFNQWSQFDTYDAGAPIITLDETWHRMDVHSAANDFGMYINNGLQYSNATNTVIALDGAGAATIGQSVRASPSVAYAYWNGQIAEVLIYSRALSGAERVEVDTYLADKYGL